MPAICLYFQAHQPQQLLPAPSQSLGHHVDLSATRATLSQVADHVYLPANELFADLISQSSGRFRIALSLSGTLVDLCAQFRPDVLRSFQQLISLGGVELIAETYHHSIAFVHSNREFDRQVELHLECMEEQFNVRPRIFRNSELIYNDAIAAKAETMGFDGVLAEGPSAHCHAPAPTFLYRAPETARIKTLLRHVELSNQLASQRTNHQPEQLNEAAAIFCQRIAQTPGDVVNLFLPYESIGIYQRDAFDILNFWRTLPESAEDAGLQWVTPSESVDLYRASQPYHCRFLSSWTNSEHDLSPWIGNALQCDALDRIHALEKRVHASKQPHLLDLWAQTQTSNHFHWMASHHHHTGQTHAPASPYRSPQDAYERLMTMLDAIEAAISTQPTR